jgi:hypothetical protein
MSKCPIWVKEQYVKRDGRVCTHLHFNICKETEVELDSEHVSKLGKASPEGNVTILWT